MPFTYMFRKVMCWGKAVTHSNEHKTMAKTHAKPHSFYKNALLEKS